MTDDPRPLLEARYGTAHVPHGIHLTPAVETMLAHRSVRRFTEDPLPEGALETMVAAAQSASTSSNLHMWSVIAVSDPERKKELQRLARSDSQGIEQSFVSAAPTVLMWVADLSRNHEIVQSEGGEGVVFEHLDVFLMASIDAALAAQNAAVAAESMGLGITYLGSMRNHARELAEYLNLPKHTYAVMGMAVGVPDPDKAGSVRPRPAQDVVLHRERYEAQETTAWADHYEEAVREFRSSNQMTPRTWAQSVATATGRGYLDGREDLRATLEDRGFGFD